MLELFVAVVTISTELLISGTERGWVNYSVDIFFPVNSGRMENRWKWCGNRKLNIDRTMVRREFVKSFNMVMIRKILQKNKVNDSVARQLRRRLGRSYNYILRVTKIIDNGTIYWSLQRFQRGWWALNSPVARTDLSNLKILVRSDLTWLRVKWWRT